MRVEQAQAREHERDELPALCNTYGRIRMTRLKIRTALAQDSSWPAVTISVRPNGVRNFGFEKHYVLGNNDLESTTCRLGSSYRLTQLGPEHVDTSLSPPRKHCRFAF